MQGAQVHYQAYSKVNLSLSVGERASDGMHPIASKMVSVDFYDDLEVTRLEDQDISRYAIFWSDDAKRKVQIDWPITVDMAVRAHHALEVAVGYALPVQLKLQKRIPLGSGLGGGSSNAAAMLQATTELFDLDLDLATIGAALGSDVPFFVCGGSAIVTGTGQTVKLIEEEQQHLVLLLPEYGCLTSDVYSAFDALGGGVLDEKRVLDGEIFNDLFDASCQVSSELASDASLIRAIAEDDVHLSGSGSTMFVICNNAQHAIALANDIEEKTNLVAIATHTCVRKT